MSLRRLLMNFCRDSIVEMESMGELPYPPFKAPLIADNSYITHRLSRLDSYKALESFMRESGTTETLLDIGHAWFWHQEVFQWLFLERVILQAGSNLMLEEILMRRLSMGAPLIIVTCLNRKFGLANSV